jgi:hypothetical protein
VDLIAEISKLNTVVLALDTATDKRAALLAVSTAGTNIKDELRKGAAAVAQVSPIPEETYGPALAGSAIQATEVLVQALQAVVERAAVFKAAGAAKSLADSLAEHQELTKKFVEVVEGRIQSTQAAPSATAKSESSAFGMTGATAPPKQILKDMADRADKALAEAIQKFRS